MQHILLSNNLQRFRAALFVDASNYPFYLVMAAIGLGIVWTYPASMFIGLLCMCLPLLPMLNRTITGDMEDAFFEEFDAPTMDTFLKNYTIAMLRKGFSEYDIASDILTLRTVWASGDGAATMITLMYFDNKLEAIDDVSDLQQDELPPVPDCERVADPHEPAVHREDAGG